ncbi:MAG TPA: ATP-binding protein [Rhizomicrobium sp.]
MRAQLDLVADVVRSSRLTAPLLALGIAVIGSDVFGYFGHRPLRFTLLLPLAVGTVSLVAALVADRYQREAPRQLQSERLLAWFPRFVALQVAIGTSWGMVPWLLWQAAAPLNHLFLAGCMSCLLAELVMSRSSHMEMLTASFAPVVAISCLRFLLGGSLLDLGLGAGLSIVAIQFFLAARRLTHRLDEESRLRFEVEDLATELEDARDEALHGRFEAETANASKTAFLANMSHELRTPLNAILGFSEIIARECFGPVGSPRYKEYAGDINSSGAHLLSLINDLLDVAKIESGKMEIEPHPLDVRRTFETALRIVAIKARERHQVLSIELDASLPTIYADERALKQMLLNLVSNAVKFTDDGGRITVVGSRSSCGNFQIMVEDNGPGIEPDKLHRVFKPFSQADNRYDRQGGGTGLGLSLVRGLAELHGGRTWIESEFGKGCRAFIILPILSKAITAPIADATRPASAVA